MDVSFFGEMAWKSALISGAALALGFALRSRAASDRALVLRLGVAMLLLLPFIALALPALRIEAWAAPEPAPLSVLAQPALQLALPADVGLQPAEPTIWDDPTPLVLLAYLGGLAMVGSRLLAGLILLGRWTRAGREIACPEWLAAFECARWAAPGGERLRLLVSDAVPSPLSWGWLRPVILIDPDTLAEPDQAAAILAHEVAHVARRDWPVLMLTRLAAALFWFNPLVWLLEREVVQQAEEAADCEAAACVEPARYARTLISWAQVNGRMIPANSIAPSGSALARRIRAILDRRLRERPSGSALTAVAAMLCIAIAAPVAAMQLVEAARPPAPPAAPPAPALPAVPEAPDAPQTPAPPAAPRRPAPPAAPVALGDIPDVGPIVAQALAEARASMDPAEIQRSVDEALREADREVRRVSPAERARIFSEVRRAVAEARVQVAQVDRAEIAAAVREARQAAQTAPRAVAMAMASAGEGMANGAAGMEAGARHMEEQARRFRDRSYREQVIAREAARGHHVTHEQLLEAARGMEEGAQGMREGARDMREAGQRMRDGDDD
ncbi:MAG TPA: M56 family metallopeptidase [Allosphingosinicella sp.]|nr:M56 family metallopeptidase [Allosphingosinicella sp.]